MPVPPSSFVTFIIDTCLRSGLLSVVTEIVSTHFVDKGVIKFLQFGLIRPVLNKEIICTPAIA